MANISVNIDGLTTGNPQAVVDLMNVVNDPNNFDNVTPVDTDSVEDNFDFEKAVNDTFDEIDNEQQNESVEHKSADKKEVLDPRKNRVDPDEDAEGEEELLLEDEPKENNLVADLEKMEKEAQTAMGEVDKMFGESFSGKKALKESAVSDEEMIDLTKAAYASIANELKAGKTSGKYKDSDGEEFVDWNVQLNGKPANEVVSNKNVLNWILKHIAADLEIDPDNLDEKTGQQEFMYYEGGEVISSIAVPAELKDKSVVEELKKNGVKFVEDGEDKAIKLHWGLGFRMEQATHDYESKKQMNESVSKKLLKEEYGPYHDDELASMILKGIGEKLEDGNDWGYVYNYNDDVIAEWKCTINGSYVGDMIHNKSVRDWILYDVSYPVKDGFDYYNDLNLILSNNSGEFDFTDETVVEDFVKIGFDADEVRSLANNPEEEIECWANFDLAGLNMSEITSKLYYGEELDEGCGKKKKKSLKESVEVVSNENGIPLKWTVDTDELSDEDKEFLKHFIPNTYFSDADAYEYAMDEKLPSGRWLENIKPSIVYGENDRVLKADFTGFVLPKSRELKESNGDSMYNVTLVRYTADDVDIFEEEQCVSFEEAKSLANKMIAKEAGNADFYVAQVEKGTTHWGVSADEFGSGNYEYVITNKDKETSEEMLGTDFYNYEVLEFLSESRKVSMDEIATILYNGGYFNHIPSEEELQQYLKTRGLTEDTVKQGSSWVNKGKEGTHGKFKTKKAADKQRKAMFANGYKAESVNESVNIIDEDSFVNEFERLENDCLAYGKMGEFRKIVSDFLAQENVDPSSIDWTGAYVEQLGLDKSKELIRRLRTQLLGVDESVERKGTLLTEGTSNFLMFNSPNLAFTDEECEDMYLPQDFQKEEKPYWYSEVDSRSFGVTPIESDLDFEYAFVGYRYGYYEGINVGIIKNNEFEEWAYHNYDEVDGTYYEYGSDTPISKEELKKEFDSKVAEEYAKGVQFLKKLNNEYGGRFINVQAQFSNGETWYGEEKLEESYRIQQQRDLLKEAKAVEDDFDDENSFEYVWSSLVNGNLTQYQEQLKKMSKYEIREYIDWAKEQGIPYEDLQLDFMYETLNPDLQYHSREGHMVKNGTTKPCHPQRTVKTINSNGKEFAGYSPKQDEIMRDKVVTIVENFKKVIEHSDEKLYPALQRRITDKLLSEGVTTKAITKIIDNLF